jgi:penicillin G amidase
MKLSQPRRVAAIAALSLALGACGDNSTPASPDAGIPPGPFDSIQLTEDLHVTGLDGPIHAARDTYGIMHIVATSDGDLGYAEGYVMAHNRLPQMDILRRFGAGTLGELFGALDQGTVETDLEMRVHRMKPIAEETWATLQASSDPDDQKLVRVLQRFADGVNAYNSDLQAGKWTLDPAVATSFDAQRFTPWTPVDSLILGRFQAFALSWTTPIKLDITDVYQNARATFDNASPTDVAAYARRGISSDLLHITPVGRYSTIDGFPNVTTDSGTRSDSGRPGKGRKALGPKRPHVPQALLSNARAFFRARVLKDGLGMLSPHAFMIPHAGSNDWVVGPTLADGTTLIAGDQHLQMPNPSIFYPIHLTIPGEVDAEGVTFPGIPGIILGHNGKVAWQATVAFHDVNDVYLENISPCPTGGGDCVAHDGGQVKIEPWTETFKIGALGTITKTITATYEMVPHHGPIIPTVQNGMVVPRSGNQALSVEYTGYQPTYEIRATWGLIHASTVDDAFKALGNFDYGAQNWVIGDNQGNIGWTTNAKVPLRKPAAYVWNAKTNPDGLAPFFVLPGDGSADWDGYMSPRYIPHAINPANGFLVTANSDPVGEVFDGDPLNGPIVDGRPLYASALYAAGVRAERIADRIQADATTTGNKITLDDLSDIQHDSTSTMGRKLGPAITDALAYAADPTGAPPDVAGYVAGLSSGDKARLAAAHDLFAGWTYAAPTGLDPGATAQDLKDSTTTAIFNVFMHFFIQDTLGDEYDAINFNVWDIQQDLLARNVYALLVEPAGLVQSATTGQPILCDDMTTAGADESCTRRVMQATLEAMDWLASGAAYGSADPGTWHWGELHRLIIPPLFPNSDLDVPAATDPTNPTGFPKPGDNIVVNRADCGWDDLDFHQEADGPAERFLAELPLGGTAHVEMELPGGTIYDRSSKHYRDLLDDYYLPQKHFDLPYTTSEIVAHGEERWVFH